MTASARRLRSCSHLPHTLSILLFVLLLGLSLSPSLGMDARAQCGVLDRSPQGTLGVLTLGDGAVIDTDAGTIYDGEFVVGEGSPGVSFFTQPDNPPFAPPELCVFDFTRLTISAGCTVTATGSRGLALIASDEILIAGTLDLQGQPGGNGSVNLMGAGGAPGPGAHTGGEFVSGLGCVFGNGVGDGPGAGEAGSCGGGGGLGGEGTDGGGGGGGGGACSGSGGAGASHAMLGSNGEAGSTGNSGLTADDGPGTGGSGGVGCTGGPSPAAAGFGYGDPQLAILYGGSGGSSGGFGGFAGFGGDGIGLGGTGYGGSAGFSGGPGGGGGGGGILLVCASVNFELSSNGHILANGGGGGAGAGSGLSGNGQTALFGAGPIGGGGGGGRSGHGGGGGGGAGGSVFVNAPSIIVDGFIDVSGGAGGAATAAGSTGAFGGLGRNGGAPGAQGGSSASFAGNGGSGGTGFIVFEDVVTGITSPIGTRRDEMWLTPPEPNPMVDASSRFAYAAPKGSAIELAIYDLHGRRIAVIEKGLARSERASTAWNGRDQQGRNVSAGIYFVVLRSDSRVVTRKFALLR